MTQPIEIQIPDDAWREWPDEEGWHFVGSPGEHEPRIANIRTKLRESVITDDDWVIHKANQCGYRFARISLPEVPEAKR